MEIRECSGLNVEDNFVYFFQMSEDSNGEVSSRGKFFVEVIKKLLEHQDEYRVFALNSQDRLCLLAEENYDTPWYVMVEATPGGYLVEYFLHDTETSDQNRWDPVGLPVSTVDEVVQMIFIAMLKAEFPINNP